MQIEGLRVFCDLAESRSFTSAARINQITQSAVSQQISSLERHFDTLLVERSKKMFRLTKEGQLLYDHSKEIINTFETLTRRMQSLQHVVSGNIRVSTIYSIGLHTLPPFLKKFLKKFPTVNVHVEYSYADKILEDVLSNVVDLGLVAYPGKDNKLNIIPLMEESLVLICEPCHPLAKRGQIKLGDIAGENLVGFHIDIPTRRAFINITPQVEELVQQSGVAEGLCLVNAMHITASVFINDDESGLHADYERWLEELAPHEPVDHYRHNDTGEDNADAHLKRQVMGREVVVAITKGRLHFGPWEQIFYGEFDGKRKKRVLVKVIGE